MTRLTGLVFTPVYSVGAPLAALVSHRVRHSPASLARVGGPVEHAIYFPGFGSGFFGSTILTLTPMTSHLLLPARARTLRGPKVGGSGFHE